MTADTMKLYTKAHGAKVSTLNPFSPAISFAVALIQTTNLIINLDNDDWILDDDSKILADIGFGAQMLLMLISKPPHPHALENETEVSLFNLELYRSFQLNPEVQCVFSRLPCVYSSASCLQTKWDT